MATQKNFSFFEYVDDNAVNWCIRGEDGGAGSAIDGHATDHANPYWGRVTKRKSPRYAVFQDPVTFRTVKFIVYTPTAFALIGSGDTITVPVEGEATGVTYEFAARIPEKQSVPRASRHLADSA
jgi:hypothetical protein